MTVPPATVTVDFPYFCGNYTETATKALQEHTGKFNSNGSTRLQGETVTSQGGTRDLATNWTELQQQHENLVQQSFILTHL